MSEEQHTPAVQPSELPWGRVLICGGTDWPKLGKKERPGVSKPDEDINPDLLEPHILRSLSNVKITSIHTSCNGCHFVALDTDGVAWLFGDEICACACGRNHTLLVGSDGNVWTAGANTLGQCGHSVCPEVTSFKLVHGISHGGNKEHVIKAAAGVTFSIVLTESGKVFSFGSAEKGQLGNGTTGERITTGNKTAYDIEYQPVYIKELKDNKIVQIASGQQHSIALDATGLVHVWGYNGYCRLGLGNQVDILKPKVVPQFAGPNEISMGAFVAAGPSNSVVIDKQGMYYMAGKWKNSGEGSSGSPYSSFRLMQEITGCKISLARCGGVTHWALTPDEEEGIMTVAWGQNAANGELGLGFDEPKSATKPTKHVPLTGIEVFDIAAGQNTTLILAKPSDKLSDLSRHPVEINPPPLCVKCGLEKGDDDSPLECDKCDSPYHIGCLDPPLDAVPPGEWFCVDCESDPGAAVGAWAVKKTGNKKKPNKMDEGGSSDTEAGGKRKASAPKAKTSAPKKKKQ
ncbi:RCC1/BLIP-II [Infundibulicybe gibba]|nr:RCC1/BLIP-II [Infundibulicybe gibba]